MGDGRKLATGQIYYRPATESEEEVGGLPVMPDDSSMTLVVDNPLARLGQTDLIIRLPDYLIT